MPRIELIQQVTTYEDRCDVCNGVVLPMNQIETSDSESYGYVNPEKNLFIHHNCMVDAIKTGVKYAEKA